MAGEDWAEVYNGGGEVCGGGVEYLCGGYFEFSE